MKGKWIWAGAAALAIVLGGGAWYAMWGRGAQPGRESRLADVVAPTAISAPLFTAGYVTAPQWLEATGTVRAELEAPIATRVTGRVVAVLAREGDRVRRGQPLVDLDARDLSAAVVQARANIRAANVGYDNARVAARMEQATSSARIAAADAQVSQSEAAVKAARAKLDLVQTGPRKQERTQATLAVMQAKANLGLAETNLRRYQSLVSEGAISQQQFDQAKTQFDVAKAQYDTAVQSASMTEEGSRQEDIRQAQEGVRQAEAALSQAQAGLRQAQATALQTNVRREEIRAARAQVGQSQAALQIAQVTRDYATIAAPFDGVVTDRLADPGALVNPGTPLLKVQGGRIRLEAVVPEGTLAYVRRGMVVPVTLDAMRDRELRGRVTEIAPQGDPSSHTFIVKIDLPAGSGARAGMFGRARFTTGTDRRLMVPASAVVSREGLHYLYVVDDGGTARLRMVTVGEPEGERLPVLSGLNPGERIVAGDIERVWDGVKVR